MAEIVTTPTQKVRAERERCAAIVRDYRDALLREIEAKIRRVDIPDISKERIVDGGFSMAELHMAGELIEQLTANPFEE